jgi:25S rRNA (uracil2634-N3)-methyltransferase
MALTCGLYRSDQRILLAGDGDLSFTLALARAFGSGQNLTATTLDDTNFLESHYPKVAGTIDAFNFPHPGWPKRGARVRSEDSPVMIERHRALLRGFFASARRIAHRPGCPPLEVHVTHKVAPDGSDWWGVAALGEECGFELVGAHAFDARPFHAHGYEHKYGVPIKEYSLTWNVNRSFPLRFAATSVFRLTSDDVA